LTEFRKQVTLGAMSNVEFLYLPVPDLGKALAFYRDTLGWSEAWREGETTASLRMPGEHLQLMIDEVVDEPLRPGPVVTVDDVRAWHAERRDTLQFWRLPAVIPGGYWAAFEDGLGNAVYIADQSTADA
jgi:catechol 2,3-dioxygenase-like lactoylglutathione lyase family enzyme